MPKTKVPPADLPKGEEFPISADQETISVPATTQLPNEVERIIPADVGKAVAVMEKRAQLMDRLFTLACKQTTEADWFNFGKNPWPSNRAVQVFRSLFGISLNWIYEIYPDGKIVPMGPKRVDCSDDEGNYYYYVAIMRVEIPGLLPSMVCVGTASSRDKFYAIKHVDGEEVHKPLSQISEVNIAKHSVTNCMHNGVMNLLGMKGATWDQLRKAGLSNERTAGVEFDGSAKKRSQEKAKEKKDKPAAAALDRDKVLKGFFDVLDYLEHTGAEDSDKLCQKYLARKDADEQGNKYASRQQVATFKNQGALKWVSRATKQIAEEFNIDKEDFKEWLSKFED